jgi:hypothetical protein
MLKQSTRERLQLLIQHPDFEGSVHIVDKKMFHRMDNGEPTFYVDVNIHAEGSEVFTLLAVQFPEMQVTNVRDFNVDLGEKITYGKMADGKIEEAEVIIWANYGEAVKEKAPIAVGAVLKNTHSDYTTESEVVANA